MNYIKIKRQNTMIFSTIALALLFSSSGYSSIGDDEVQLQPRGQISQQLSPVSLYEVTQQEAFSPGATTINIAPDFKDFDAAEVKEKTKQLMVMGSAISTLAALTLYYACTTEPSEWLSGTAGSYCTNAILTSMGAAFLYRDRKNMLKRQAANK